MTDRTGPVVPDTRGLRRLDGSLVVLTGGTRGIGQHAAAGLARLGAEVVITGRDGARGGHAVGVIAAAVPGAAVRFVPADLSTLAGPARPPRCSDRRSGGSTSWCTTPVSCSVRPCAPRKGST